MLTDPGYWEEHRTTSMSKRVGVLIGGGDSSAVHAFLWGLLRRLEQQGDALVGFEEGWLGAADGRMRPVAQPDLRPLVFTAGSLVGSSSADLVADRGVLERVLAHLDDAGIDTLIVAGNHAAMQSAAAVSRLGVRVIGIPQSIDNDVAGSESALGFPTAVQRAVEASTPALHEGWASGHDVVIECPGKMGWLALSVALGTFADALLIPEVRVDAQRLVRGLATRARAGQPSVCVVAAQGTAADDGPALAGALGRATGRHAVALPLGDVVRGGPPCERDLWQANLLADHAAYLVNAHRCGVVVGLQGGRPVEIPIERCASRPHAVTLEWIRAAQERGLVAEDAA